MKNLWPEGFKPNDVNPPKKILDDQSKLLPKLTGDMVYAKVKEMSDYDAATLNHQDDFSYQFFLLGKFLRSYKFKVFDFSHSITMYPVDVSVDIEIAEELGIEGDARLETEEEFIKLISIVFNSERLKNVIGSIIQISADK
ncbi:hypothetical protein [Pseudoalteromonas spongiae]|uniref:hypothetical protein n=1 Tax=Pseudoalteromonas spongiae TaxID=298657 RepID=UPI000C2D054A|nr:hypothetical protein [Pseudoalteromonas spongiae]